MYDKVVAMLKDRGVEVEDIAQLVFLLQSKYKDITIVECTQSVLKVLAKREIQNAVITGVQLDKLAEKDMLEEPLLSIIKSDEPLYGIDEILALSITNVYGSIGFTNYGYLDKEKPGILEYLNRHSKGQVNTFLDDIVAGIAAAASARIAHKGEKL
ncbi:MAG: phosphatidylglycerophosphatase A [Clostridia bacterium]|nr:phosphatidylglycerophosphatase A [Clostridia bacterium]